MFKKSEAHADALVDIMGRLGSDAPADMHPFMTAFALDAATEALLKVDMRVSSAGHVSTSQLC